MIPELLSKFVIDNFGCEIYDDETHTSICNLIYATFEGDYILTITSNDTNNSINVDIEFKNPAESTYFALKYC
jgi:hypothetical protein